MFARNVSLHLKANMLSDYTRTFEKEILPLLRKQHGFRDEIPFPDLEEAGLTAISLWENKTDADAYNTNAYPQVLKTMERFIEGVPKVQTSNISNSIIQEVTVGIASYNERTPVEQGQAKY